MSKLRKALLQEIRDKRYAANQAQELLSEFIAGVNQNLAKVGGEIMVLEDQLSSLDIARERRKHE